jgi:lysyl-tRNA synthetase class 2
VCGGTKVTWDGTEIELAAPWRRLTIKDAVRELGGIAEADRVFEDPAFAADVAGKHGVSPKDIKHVMTGDVEPRIKAGHLGYLVFEATAEAKLVQPTFLTQFPLAVSPLARKNDKDPAFCDRFELFINGKEIANGFSELNDPDDQRARFQAQVAAKAAGAEETMDYDEDYCRALEVGMPPTAGEGIGIDRLTMLLTGQPSIRDVILFPLMRAE